MYQAKYTEDIMKKFNMVELKPVSTPIGSVLYLTAIRPDIQFTVGLCARF
jgi:hypothetical protein